MIDTIICISLTLSLLNWFLFLVITIVSLVLSVKYPSNQKVSLDKTEAQAFNPLEITKEAGNLAIAFNKAGAAATAAAMSMIYFLFALIAMGIEKI